MSHEVINARVYAFLDDAPLEERRTQAVVTRRSLNVKTADDLGTLDPRRSSGCGKRLSPTSPTQMNCTMHCLSPTRCYPTRLATVLRCPGHGSEAASFYQDTSARHPERSEGTEAQSSSAPRRCAPSGDGRSLWIAAERVPCSRQPSRTASLNRK